MTAPADLSDLVAEKLAAWPLFRGSADPVQPQRVSGPELLLADSRVVFTVQERLAEPGRDQRRVARTVILAAHFSPRADVVVHDAELGSLGLVYAIEDVTADLVRAAVEAADAELRPRLEALLENVVALTRANVERAFEDADTPIPAPVAQALDAADARIRAQVELALDEAAYTRHLLVNHPHRRSRQTLAVELVLAIGPACDVDPIARVLRRYAAEHENLRNIGVNLLHVDPAAADDPRAWQRAFPWLLAWTGELLAQADWTAGDGGEVAPLRTLELGDFRSFHELRLDLQRAPVHLIHGFNGSGKSSIAEALELALTGRLERVAGDGPAQELLKSVLRRRAPGSPRREDRATVVLRLGDGRHHDIEIAPASPIAQLRSAAALTALGFRLDQPAMDRLARANGTDRAVALLDGFFPEEQTVRTAHAEAQARLNEDLKQLDARLADLPRARQALDERRRPWSGRRAETVARYAATLNRWLHLSARIDLVERRWSLSNVAAAAELADGDPLREFLAMADDQLAAMDAALAAAHEELGAVEKELDMMHVQEVVDEAETAADVARLEPADVMALSRAGELLHPSYTARSGLLGQALQQAIDGETREWGSFPLGTTEGWADDFIDRIDEIVAARSALDQRQPDGKVVGWPALLEEPPTEFLDAALSRAALDEAAEAADRALSRRLTDLGVNDALNELLALFTTARWAYEQVELEQVADGDEAVAVLRSGPRDAPVDPADLRLNTAELNLLTIAIFLLCACRLENPLRLLVLDDPLQNMDELTVATLARGLGRLLRLPAWADRGWELLILLHSEENLTRFRDEFPAPVYRLPWLSPAETSKAGVVRVEPPPAEWGKVQPLS